MSYQCNIFRGADDVDCLNVVGMLSVLKAIKSGRWKDHIEEVRNETNKKARDEIKKNLPAVIFAGVFEERLDVACVYYNHVVVIDIDEITPRKLITLKKQMKLKPWVIAFFDGVTKGVKIIVSVDSPADMHRDHAFVQLEELFLSEYGVKIDRKCKNLSRLCFVSYDPECYIAESFTPIHIVEQKDEFDDFVTVHRQMNPDFYEQETNAREIFDRLVKMVKKSKTGSYRQGNRNNYVFVLSCLCGEYGLDPSDVLALVYERYSSLSFREIKSTVESAYKRIRSNFGTKSISKRTSNQSKML